MLRMITIILAVSVTLAGKSSAETSPRDSGGARWGGFGSSHLGGPLYAQPAQQDHAVSLSSLISQGFDIKAAASTAGSAAQIFLQKDNGIFVCVVFLPLDAPQRESRCSPVN
jgi:hypothetical protein